MYNPLRISSASSLTSAIPKCAVNLPQEVLDDPIDGLLVKLQLAVLCDVGGVITRATYALESDSPVIEKVILFFTCVGRWTWCCREKLW